MGRARGARALGGHPWRLLWGPPPTPEACQSRGTGGKVGAWWDSTGAAVAGSSGGLEGVPCSLAPLHRAPVAPTLPRPLLITLLINPALSPPVPRRPVASPGQGPRCAAPACGLCFPGDTGPLQPGPSPWRGWGLRVSPAQPPHVRARPPPPTSVLCWQPHEVGGGLRLSRAGGIPTARTPSPLPPLDGGAHRGVWQRLWSCKGWGEPGDCRGRVGTPHTQARRPHGGTCPAAGAWARRGVGVPVLLLAACPPAWGGGQGRGQYTAERGLDTALDTRVCAACPQSQQDLGWGPQSWRGRGMVSLGVVQLLSPQEAL